MKRTDINKDDQWDLSTMYASQAIYETEFEKAESLLAIIVSYEGHIADNKESFQTFFDQLEEFNRLLEMLYMYPKMCTDVDPEDELAQRNFSKIMVLYQNVNVSTTFIPLEVIKHKSEIEVWLRDEDMQDYRYPMHEIFRTIPHRLDEKTEALMAQVEDVCHVSEETFDSFRPEFPDVIVDGKPEFLNDGTYHQFLLHRDRDVRKQAFEHYFNEYKRYQNVFKNLLTGHAKGQILKARVHKFDSALQASLFEDDANERLYDKILNMANVTYRPYLHDYFRMRKSVLGFEQQHPYDINLPLVNDVDITYSIDESFQLLKEALRPLGEDYIAMLDTARAEHWIDFKPHAGKRGGAYSSGTHDPHAYILMNFTGQYDSLSTLAHEFGHAMHSYYSSKHNRPMLRNYQIFVAEVASTVNELLLNEHLMKHCDDTSYKAYLLDNLMMQLIGTLYRQPMYAQFESYIHESLENHVPLSSQEITETCLQLYKDYFGDDVDVDDLQRYSCYMIPHYYYNFYVYKYALGMAVAIAFVKRIQQGDVQSYREFLTKGGSESPIDELVHSGINPEDDQVYHDAFSYFNELLNEFKSINA